LSTKKVSFYLNNLSTKKGKSKMTSEALFLRKLDKVINKQIVEQDRMTAWQVAFVEFARRQSRIWPYFFIPTVLFGFSAAFILFYQFIIKL